MNAFSRAVGRIAAAWALALAPVSGRAVVEMRSNGRDEILLVPDGPILVHPLLMIDRQHPDLHDRLDATVGWHLADAEQRLDAAAERIRKSGDGDRAILWLDRLTRTFGYDIATGIAQDRWREQRALWDRYRGVGISARPFSSHTGRGVAIDVSIPREPWHFPFGHGQRATEIIVDEGDR